jgi:hypothetical protein
VAPLFPFSGPWGTVVEHAPAIETTMTALPEARDAESHAIERLAEVVGLTL